MAPRKAAHSDAIDLITIEYDSGLPVWIQIKNRIIYLIGSGEFVAGDRLPTVRSLALELDISYNTVNRAYMDLERDGYVTTRKGRGTFVAEQQGKPAQPADASISILVDDMIRAAKLAGMHEEDILALVQRRLSLL